MALARQTDAKLVKPLDGAIIRRRTVGADAEAGEIVAMQSDGYVDPADATAAADPAYGIALQDVSSGDAVDLVVFGPVDCMTGGTPGTVVYVGTTPGEPATAAGTYGTVVGVMESATTLFFRPASV